MTNLEKHVKEWMEGLDFHLAMDWEKQGFRFAPYQATFMYIQMLEARKNELGRGLVIKTEYWKQRMNELDQLLEEAKNEQSN